ncbi:hypothetical protein AAA294_13065 [Fusobacterium varium]|uniref:hypothetical protein n=1 Tax=Fusobacterium varium TaxID=856 RepID=UPI0032C1923C
MVKFTDEDREFINENFDEAYDMLYMYDVEGVLITIAKFIAAYCYDDEYELTELGEIAQSVYTRIYDNNREVLEK